MDVDDIVVGVIQADLAFELVVERKGVKKYRIRRDIWMLKRTLLASQLKKHIQTTLQVYHVYHPLLQ